MIEQLRLFTLPERRLEPGEPYRCFDCGAYDSLGAYGPGWLVPVTLSDGSEDSVNLRDQWLCYRHSVERWDDWRQRQIKLPARQLRWRAFRIAAARGYRGDELYRVAEGWLRDGLVPTEV